MYVPPAFREDDLAVLHATMREARLANLVTATGEGLVATPLPLFLAAEEGPYGTLYGHLARANSQWRLPATGEAMALFMGPDAYVSPSWYPRSCGGGCLGGAVSEDGPDGAGTARALGAAAAGREDVLGPRGAGGRRRADLAVGQGVAEADIHRGSPRCGIGQARQGGAEAEYRNCESFAIASLRARSSNSDPACRWPR
jgi:hypothetical protein